MGINRESLCGILKGGAAYMKNDVVYNKAQIMEWCLKRIHEEYDHNDENLKNYNFNSISLKRRASMHHRYWK